MEKVIGKKSLAVGILYGGVAGIGLFAIIYLMPAILQGGTVDLIPFILLAVFEFVCLVISLLYFKVPMNAIILKNYNEIYLPGYKTTLLISEIKDISCKRARARGITYKWGTVLISTRNETYRVRFLSDCENTSTILQRLKNEQRYIG